MKQALKTFLYIVLTLITIAVINIGFFIYKAKNGIPVYESRAPKLPSEMKDFSVLLFSKTNAFRHSRAIKAAIPAFQKMAEEKGWTLFSTANGAVFNAEQLAKFDVVIWNNCTGRVLKDEQRAAFKSYMEKGGGFVGVHGSGDGSHKWDWYEDELIGARFSHHSLQPQFQLADMYLECNASSSFPCSHLSHKWTRSEEWYVFNNNPRNNGFTPVYTVDENTFNPSGNLGSLITDKDFGMGDDHPIVWYKELAGGGRSFYSALGHSGDAFAEEKVLELMERGIEWAGQ
ncbi:MAG: ThuA domain-containing protein [Saprospiraceae bacterium]|nr:ThuA domain-containing protein [Saprospiraceae bacterium]